MPSDLNKHLQTAIAPTLKVRGFSKSGATWRRIHPDAIALLNLQGSQWSPSFYVNLGIYFRPLGTNERPLEYNCHIRTRLDELVPDRARLAQLLDFDQPIPEPERFAEVAQAVSEYAVPWLDHVSSIAGAREYCLGVHPRSPWVTADARRLLQLSPGV